MVLRASTNLLIGLGVPSPGAALAFALVAARCRTTGSSSPGWRSRRSCPPCWSRAPTTRPTRCASWPSRRRTASSDRPAAHGGRRRRRPPARARYKPDPQIRASVVTWLLPALAIALVLLVLLTRWSAVVSLSALSAAWLLGIVALRAGDQLDVVTAPVGQSVSLLVAAAAAPLSWCAGWATLRPEPRTQS